MAELFQMVFIKKHVKMKSKNHIDILINFTEWKSRALPNGKC